MKRIQRVKFISADGLAVYDRRELDYPPSYFRRILSPTTVKPASLLREDAEPSVIQTRLYQFWICKGKTAIYREKV